MNAKRCINQNDQLEIEQKIAEIESKSSAEIICAIATESGRYDQAESIIGLLFSLLFLAVAESVYSSFEIESYTGEPVLIPFGWQTFAIVFGFFIGLTATSLWKPLRSVFVLSSEKNDEVLRAANHIFFTQRIRSTAQQNGMLIYISLFERKIVVRADDGILKIISENELNSIIQSIIPTLKNKKWKNTFLSILNLIEPKLVEDLPLKNDDRNELSNNLLLFHPRP